MRRPFAHLAGSLALLLLPGAASAGEARSTLGDGPAARAAPAEPAWKGGGPPGRAERLQVCGEAWNRDLAAHEKALAACGTRPEREAGGPPQAGRYTRLGYRCAMHRCLDPALGRERLDVCAGVPGPPMACPPARVERPEE